MAIVIEKGEIPDKLYFKIGEVCEIVGTKPHTLRFWESEFKVIRPKRATGNQRLYRRIDVETILEIKHLIYDEGFTIAGTRKYLARRKKGNPAKQSLKKPVDYGLLKKIKSDLLKLKTILEK